MRNLFYIVLASCSFFCVKVQGALTENVDGRTWTYTISDGEATIVASEERIGNTQPSSLGYRSLQEDGEIVIPNRLGGCPVTRLESFALYNLYRLKSVVIPKTVRVIGYKSFYNCYSLRSIDIPDSVEIICSSAFQACAGLKSVVIPDGVTVIEADAFGGCGLKTVKIPRSVTEIKEGAFAYCDFGDGFAIYDGWLLDISTPVVNQERIVVPNNVRLIADGVLRKCKDMTFAVLPGSLENMPMYAFAQCTKLEAISLPSGLKKISLGAFDSCSNLSSVEIPDTVVQIEDEAFEGCTSLSSVVLPTRLSMLGRSAFSGCTSLTHMYMRTCEFTTISKYTFKDCSALVNVWLPASVTCVESDAFESCHSLANVVIGGIPFSYSPYGKLKTCFRDAASGARGYYMSDYAADWVSLLSSSEGKWQGLNMSRFKGIISTFDCVRDGENAIKLSWMTGLPYENVRFDIYRSTDAAFLSATRIADNLSEMMFRDLTWTEESLHVSAFNYWVVAKDGDVEIGRSEMATVSVATKEKDLVPVACDWTKGEIELGWSGADVSYKLFWSTSSDPDVSTNDVRRLVSTDVKPTEEGAYRFTCKDPEYLKRGDCLQPIYYHIVGTDGSWSFCKTRNRHGIFYGLAKYDKVKFPELSERENRAESAEFFAKMMKEQGGMEKDNARCRVDGEATIGNLRKDFNEVAELVIPGDVFIFFCSTHGGSSKEGRTRVCLYDDRYFDNELALTLKSVGTRSDGTSKDVAIINVIAACHSGGFFEIDGKSDEYLDDWYVSEQLARCSPNIAWVTSASYDSNSWGFSPYPMLQTFMLYYGWRQGWAGTDEYVTFGELARYAKGMVHDLMYDECKTEPQLEPELGGVLDAIRAGKRGKHSAMSIPSESALSYVSRGEYPDKVVCEWKGTDGADGYALFEKRERDEIWSCGGCVLADSSCQENGYRCQWAFKKDENRPYVDDKGKFHIKAYNGAGISPASDAVDGWCSWVEGKIGDLSYAYNLNADWSATLLRIGGRDGLQTGVTGLLSLPSEVDGHQVSTIAAGALRNCSEIKQVTVPNTVRSLLPASFPNCTGLNTVIFNGAMPDGIEESRILDHATEVYYPQVYAAQYEKVVPAELFAGYVDVDIPADGVYTKTVNGIEWVYTIKDGIAILGYDGNSYPGPAAISASIEGKVVIPAAFDGCPLVKIGYNAFCRCANLTEINIPDSVTEIGAAVFFGCCQLSKVDLPTHLVRIGDQAFMSCESLKRVEIPADVVQMGGSVFYSCTGLQDIIVHEGNEQFMSKEGVLFSKDGRKLIAFPGGRQEISLPPEVAKIESGAFCGSTVKRVRVVETVRELGYYVFENSFVEELELPATLTELPYCMCYGCKSLVKVVLHDGVIEVGKSTFYGCASLNTVVIPKSVLKIESEAFAYCGTLSNVDFSGAPPSDVADDAFANVQAGCVGTYRAEHAGAWARVIDGNGMWKGLKMMPYNESVREAAVSLRNGWNWISVNVVPTEAAFASAFGEVAFAENDVIRSSDGSATYSGGTWHPNPSSFKLVAGRAYAVKKSTAGMATVMVSGTAAPAEIAVAAGWNWIGPTATSSVPLGSLTHTGGFSDGDIINSPTASATYHGGTWYGELKSIVPGSGYKARFGKAGTLRW